MKKTRFFSRIFAAFLAAATAIVSLSTPGVAADPTPKYTVNIISPDVPDDGSTYTYKFYQIISGNVEKDENGKNIIANPQWGKAFGGDSFGTTENVTLVQADDSNPDAVINELNITKAEALITAISETDANNSSTSTSEQNTQARGRASAALGRYFANLVINYQSDNSNSGNGFKPKFAYGLNNGSPRTVSGFVEVLSTVNNSQTLKAFTELLFNGISAGSYSWDSIANNTVDLPEIKFLDGGYNPKQIDITGAELSVELDEPGYYLVACVKDDKLTNDSYTTKPKPVSAMLLLVGEGTNEIVGKNTTAVATVDIKMFHEPLHDLKPIENQDNAKYEFSLPDDAQTLGYFDDPTTDYDTSKWVDRASFGNLQRHIIPDSSSPSLTEYYDEYVLCRLDITLPENFESYKDVGYFLAVAGDWGIQASDGKIVREACRPLIYVKHSDGSGTKVGNLCLNINYPTSESKGLVTNASSSTSTSLLNPLYRSGNPFGVNDGKTAMEYFYLGNLFNTGWYPDGTFNGGDLRLLPGVLYPE